MVLAYRDLLGAVSDYHDSRSPSKEDLGCLRILEQASELPTPESSILQVLASTIGEEAAHTALQLAKAFGIVSASTTSEDPMLYAPRVWSGLHSDAGQALSPMDRTDREILLNLVNLVRQNQGYPETLLGQQAELHGARHLMAMAIGLGLMNRTELFMSDGTKRSFLTTPHFYTDLVEEYGEYMCDRVKIFLDPIRNGQYFGRQGTGRILDPQLLLSALLNRGQVGPATAIATDYIVAEKAGIIRVQRSSARGRAFLELGQEDTVRKVLEIVSVGTTEPGTPKMSPDHMSGGPLFRSIEQGRADFRERSREVADLEGEILKHLREG